jgi:hypothetical protein
MIPMTAQEADMADANDRSEKRHVVGWLLDRGQRAQLLSRFPPVYPDVIADHVTLSSTPEPRPIPKDSEAEIVGEADDGAGVQALVVRLGGTTDRPDGSTYHLTWSIDVAKGREAIHSNDVIRALGWKPLAEPIPIKLEGASW